MSNDREAYDRARKAYQLAGKKARGKPHDSQIYKDYEEAKRIYHRAGEKLRKG